MNLSRKFSVALFSILVAVLLSACAGTMRGMVQQSGDSVSLHFEDTGFGYGQLKTTLPDGETFQGKFVEESSTSFGTGFGTAWSGNTTGYGTTFGTVESFSGNIEAVLFGDRKHTMKCCFRAADSMMGLPSGGIGMCQVSDGRVIDVQF